MSSSELLKAVLQLPPQDRRELVFSAWKSLDPLDETDSACEVRDSSEFADEIERRLDEAIYDPSLLCDEDDVLREARQLVGRKSC